MPRKIFQKTRYGYTKAVAVRKTDKNYSWRKNARHKPKAQYVSLYKAPTIAEKRFFTKINYYSGDVGGVVTTSPHVQQFRLNSIYDPDYTHTLTGHQPLGHDELKNIYLYYRVLGCKIVVKTANATAFAMANIVAFPHGSLSYPASISDAIEQPFARSIVIQDKSGVNTIKAYYRNNSVFNVTKNTYNSDDKYRSLFGYNPDAVSMVTIMGQHIDGSTAVSIGLTVKLTYYVVMSQLRVYAQS